MRINATSGEIFLEESDTTKNLCALGMHLGPKFRKSRIPVVRFLADTDRLGGVIDTQQLFRLDVLQEEPNSSAPSTAEVKNGVTRLDRANLRLVILLEKSVRIKSLSEG